MNLTDVLSTHAARSPEAPAIVEAGRTIDYRTLENAVWHAAGAFRGLGIRPGDIVGLQLPNSAGHLLAGLALARLGAIQVSLAEAMPAHLQEKLERRFDLKTIVHGSDIDDEWFYPGPRAAPIDTSLRSEGGSSGWKIVLTSGASGMPKAVLQTHAMLIACSVISNSVEHLAIRPGDRYLAITAFDYYVGFKLCLDCLAGGATVVIPGALQTADDLMRTIREQRINYLQMLPPMLRRILEGSHGTGLAWPELRVLRMGGMAIPKSLLHEVRRRLTRNTVMTYAMNEVGTVVAAATPDILDRDPAAAGTPLPGIELEVVDPSDRPVAAGSVGAIRVRVPLLAAGYMDDPAATAKNFRNGWYYPGDLGRLSAEGVLYFKGRADDVMNVSGVKIYPAEIESALLDHPQILEAAAFPVTDAGRQEQPAAAVVLRQWVDHAELQNFAYERLGGHAPRYIVPMTSLPRNPVGKVLKRELAAQISTHLQGQRRTT